METEHEEQQQEEKIELPPTAYRSARRGAVSAEPFDPTDAAPSETVRQFSCETDTQYINVGIIKSFRL